MHRQPAPSTHTAAAKRTNGRPFQRLAVRLMPVVSAVLPTWTGRWAARQWTTIPRRPGGGRPIPAGGTGFTARFEGHVVHGMWWGEGAVVYLVHGWAADSRQWAPVIPALCAAGYRVVAFDAPSHGHSDPGSGGPHRSNGVEFGKALDAVAAVHGPAQAVVAHSLGALATLLCLRYGWLSTRSLVFLAPMNELRGPLDQYAAHLRLSRRARRSLTATVEAEAGLPIDTFDLRALAHDADGAPLLLVHDRHDHRANVASSAQLVADWPGAAALITTEGLGHSRLLAAPSVHHDILDFLSESRHPAPDDLQRPGSAA